VARQVEDGRPLPFKSFCYRAPGPTIFCNNHIVINFGADPIPGLQKLNAKLTRRNRYTRRQSILPKAVQ
jgi:hypothetical protein